MWIEKQHAYGYKDIEAASIVFFSMYHLMFHSLEIWNQLVTRLLHLLIFSLESMIIYLHPIFLFTETEETGTLMVSYLQGSLPPPNISISLFTHHFPIFPFNSPFKPSKCPSISPCVSFFYCFIFRYEVENQDSPLWFS